MSRTIVRIGALMCWLITIWFVLEYFKIINLPIETPTNIDYSEPTVYNEGTIILVFWFVIPLLIISNFIVTLVWLFTSANKRSNSSVFMVLFSILCALLLFVLSIRLFMFL